MLSYLQKLIRELIRRGHQLKGLIRCPIEIIELNALAVKCESEIDACIKNINELEMFLSGHNCDEQIIRYVYRRYQDEYRNLDLIERYGISLLKMNYPDLKYHNRLIAKIQSESNIPLTIASVASFSTDFFFYAPKTHVIFVRAAEHLSLQHIPALYHELGHYVNGKIRDLRLMKLSAKISECNETIKDYFSDILKRELLETHSKEHMKITFAIMNKWKGSWFEEIFCDGFATFLVGPAYAWSWIHIITKINDDVYFFNPLRYREHPSDEARFRFMLHCLNLSGFNEESEKLQSVWGSLIFVSSEKGSPDYNLAFGDDLFRRIAILIRTGLVENNFSLATPERLRIENTTVLKSLNETWEYFWKAPDSFWEFETKTIEQLMGD